VAAATGPPTAEQSTTVLEAIDYRVHAVGFSPHAAFAHQTKPLDPAIIRYSSLNIQHSAAAMVSHPDVKTCLRRRRCADCCRVTSQRSLAGFDGRVQVRHHVRAAATNAGDRAVAAGPNASRAAGRWAPRQRLCHSVQDHICRGRRCRAEEQRARSTECVAVSAIPQDYGQRGSGEAREWTCGWVCAEERGFGQDHLRGAAAEGHKQQCRDRYPSAHSA